MFLILSLILHHHHPHLKQQLCLSLLSCHTCIFVFCQSFDVIIHYCSVYYYVSKSCTIVTSVHLWGTHVKETLTKYI